MKGYFINLDSSIDRLKTFDERLVQLGFTRTSEHPIRWKKGDVEIERLVAVNGKVLSGSERKEYEPTERKFWDWTSHHLTAGELGCFLSHRHFWRKVVEEKLNFAFVLEDDMILSPEIVSFFESIDWIPKNASFVKLDFSPVTKDHLYPVSEPLSHFCSRKIVRIVGRTYGTGCYVVSQQAALSALKHSQKIPLPVDLFLFDARFEFAPTQEIYCVFPALSLDDGGSTATIGGQRNKETLTLKQQVLKGVFSLLRRWRLKQMMKKYHLHWEKESFRA
jgi:glycosyl transferase, family 25